MQKIIMHKTTELQNGSLSKIREFSKHVTFHRNSTRNVDKFMCIAEDAIKQLL
jgi:hypothetical protein